MRANIDNTFGRATEVAHAGWAHCQKIVARVAWVKERIFAEVTEAFQAPEHLLRLAVNEAEAVVWQTPYPHLLFPTLAAEKAQETAAWSARQALVRQASPVYRVAV